MVEDISTLRIHWRPSEVVRRDIDGSDVSLCACRSSLEDQAARALEALHHRSVEATNDGVLSGLCLDSGSQSDYLECAYRLFHHTPRQKPLPCGVVLRYCLAFVSEESPTRFGCDQLSKLSHLPDRAWFQIGCQPFLSSTLRAALGDCTCPVPACIHGGGNTRQSDARREKKRHRRSPDHRAGAL